MLLEGPEEVGIRGHDVPVPRGSRNHEQDPHASCRPTAPASYARGETFLRVERSKHLLDIGELALHFHDIQDRRLSQVREEVEPAALAPFVVGRLGHNLVAEPPKQLSHHLHNGGVLVVRQPLKLTTTPRKPQVKSQAERLRVASQSPDHRQVAVLMTPDGGWGQARRLAHIRLAATLSKPNERKQAADRNRVHGRIFGHPCLLPGFRHLMRRSSSRTVYHSRGERYPVCCLPNASGRS